MTMIELEVQVNQMQSELRELHARVDSMTPRSAPDRALEAKRKASATIRAILADLGGCPATPPMTARQLREWIGTRGDPDAADEFSRVIREMRES